MKKMMISVAPVNAMDTVNEPKQIAADVYECYKLGASMVHLHCRDDAGRLTPDLQHLKETVDLIKEKCDIVIEISTGGVSGLTIQERCTPCYPNWVECNSLNVGSVNLGDAVYQNPIQDVEYCVNTILKNGKIPETEVFEIGMLHTLKQLDDKFGFVKPVFIAVVLGHIGAMPATEFALRTMCAGISEYFPDRNQVVWGITHANRTDWSVIEQAIELGADGMRIGFEDSHYINTDLIAQNNAQIVEEAVKRIQQKHREPMSPKEVRALLQIKQLGE